MKLSKQPKLDVCHTVEELIEVLKTLPPDLPLCQEFSPGVLPVVYNARTDAVLVFEEADDED